MSSRSRMALAALAALAEIGTTVALEECRSNTGGLAIVDELHSLRKTYRPRSPKKQNKVSQAKRRKYKRQGRK